MSETKAQALAHVPTLKESGYNKHPYIYADIKSAPVTFFWWASSPTGRESTYWQSFSFSRLRYSGKHKKGADGVLHEVYVPTGHYHMTTAELYENVRARSHALLPHIPRGYIWQGPFLLSEMEPPRQESDDFMFVAPEKSDWIMLGYAVSASSKGELALRLAQRILGKQGCAA